MAQRFAEEPGASIDSVLNQIAAERYSPQAAPHARQAWSAFSTAFREYPFGMQTLYFSPHLTGPANLFYARPTGYSATMVGLPYDDLPRWHGPYPPKVFANQFRKIADGWSPGLDSMERAVELANPDRRATARGDLRLAKTCQLHFASAANHVDFVLARDALAADNLTPDARKEKQAQIRRILADEISNARELYTLAKNGLADRLRSFKPLLLRSPRPGRESDQLQLDFGVVYRLNDSFRQLRSPGAGWSSTCHV